MESRLPLHATVSGFVNKSDLESPVIWKTTPLERSLFDIQELCKILISIPHAYIQEKL